MKDEPLNPEVVPPTEALVVRPPQPPGLFGATEPVAVIEAAGKVASALKDVVKRQGLVSNISGKEYPRCEAWTLLGTMLGVFPVLVWSRQVDGGWEARVEARTKDGAIVGAAEAQCLKSERNWANRDDFALRSMAQTRATAKCLRMPLGFVMTLAGYEATPAEEIVADHPQKPQKPPEGVKTPPATEKPPSGPPVHTAPKLATDATRRWWIGEIDKADCREKATQFAIDLCWILPNEKLEEIQLMYVPVSKKETGDFFAKMATWAVSGKAVAPYQHEIQPAPPAASPPTPAAKPSTVEPPGGWQGATGEPEPHSKDEWWRDVIVPIPHKGQKRADYLKHPDTIGSLFDLRHGNDEEAQAARQRLWGFVNHYEPKGWTKDNGQQMPPSDGDVNFRKALDAFQTWFERNHPDEKL